MIGVIAASSRRNNFQGYLFSGTQSQSGSDSSWSDLTNLENSTGVDGDYISYAASCFVQASGNSNFLEVSNFGFNIP